GQKHLERGKRLAYIGIMRALAQEKYDDWQEEGHPWKDLPKSVISGDYRSTEAKLREINEADVICITPESLASRLRHVTADKHTWIREIGLLAIDEIHLIAAQGRGTHMEAALMEFTLVNPGAQLIGLSATVPNVGDVAGWMSTLNGKETV